MSAYNTLLAANSDRLRQLESKLGHFQERLVRQKQTSKNGVSQIRLVAKPLRESEDWFWSRAVPVDSGCWLWHGVSNHYGSVKIGSGKETCAHRVAAYFILGDFPKLMVLHTCDVRGCVNPSHLFLGSSSDNALDAVKKGRYPRTCKKLDEEKALAILKSILPTKTLASQFGISYTTINLIRNGKAWKHLQTKIER